MKTLVIYDEVGSVISSITGSYRTPKGVPFLEVEIPVGKQIKYTDGIGVDVSKTPHEVIFEDIPISEMERLKNQIKVQEQAILELTTFVLGGEDNEIK